MGGLNATERRAQAAFERDVLAQIVALSGAGGAASVEAVEQAMGYYRHAAADNAVQTVLGRRLRGAVVRLSERDLLDASAPVDSLQPTSAGRAEVARQHAPWWQRVFGGG